MIVCHGVPENGQGHVLLPGTVFSHPDPESGTKEKLPSGHQVTLLRRLKLQHSAVPDEGVELTAGDPERQQINPLRSVLSSVHSDTGRTL